MSFDAQERSPYGGKPKEFYRFSRSASRWLYTSADQSETIATELYLPAPIKRNEPSMDKETKHSTLTLTVPRDFPVAQLFRSYSPGSSIWLTVLRLQRGDTGTWLAWKGKVRGASWNGSVATLTCDPLDKAGSRLALRRSFGSTCDHDLYSQGSNRCQVLRASFTIGATIEAIVGDTLKSAAFATKPDGWWVGGDVIVATGDDARMVIAHTGDTITLLSAFEGLSVGDALAISAGCDHSFATCGSKFSNTVNFGGWPFVPTKNPYDVGLEG